VTAAALEIVETIVVPDVPDFLHAFTRWEVLEASREQRIAKALCGFTRALADIAWTLDGLACPECIRLARLDGIEIIR
jgi:hypothetical protein